MFDSSWSIDISDRNNLSFVASVELPLPDAEQFFQESFDLAFPQVLAFASALIGVSMVVLILKSFNK